MYYLVQRRRLHLKQKQDQYRTLNITNRWVFFFLRPVNKVTLFIEFTKHTSTLYPQKRQIQIRNSSQPLLVSTPTERDIRGARGRDEVAQPINLIPELCTPTGYTDEMRKNFSLMKDVAVHTRVGPSQRVRKLLDFNRRLQSTENSLACFRDWSLALDQDLVTIRARQLNPERIQLGGTASVIADRGAWTNAFQSRNSMHTSINLGTKWVAVIPKSLAADADGFIKCILQVSEGMRFNVGPPTV